MNQTLYISFSHKFLILEYSLQQFFSFFHIYKLNLIFLHLFLLFIALLPFFFTPKSTFLRFLSLIYSELFHFVCIFKWWTKSVDLFFNVIWFEFLFSISSFRLLVSLLFFFEVWIFSDLVYLLYHFWSKSLWCEETDKEKAHSR